MERLSRRTILRGAAAGALLPAFGSAAAGGTVETVVSIPDLDKVPENLAVDDEGALYFGIATVPGEVWRVGPAQTQQTGLSLADIERVARLPSGTTVLGVEAVPDGTLYVMVPPPADDAGVWRVPRDGGEPSFHAAIPGFANDVNFDRDRERLLVSDSFGGAVYEVPLDAADPATAASVWVGTAADDATGLLDTASFGANGIAVGEDGAVYVAVTRVHETAGDPESDPVRGRIVRVPVAGDGSAGDPELFLESEALLGADGIAARGPQLYVAANSLDEVVRVAPSKRVTTVASADDGLVFPSDVAFGTTPRQRGDLFVCNFAIDTPGAGAILRMRP